MQGCIRFCSASRFGNRPTLIDRYLSCCLVQRTGFHAAADDMERCRLFAFVFSAAAVTLLSSSAHSAPLDNGDVTCAVSMPANHQVAYGQLRKEVLDFTRRDFAANSLKVESYARKRWKRSGGYKYYQLRNIFSQTRW
jgi:hypothetical protein